MHIIMLSMKQYQTSYSQINYTFNIIMTGRVKQAVTRLDDKTLLMAVFTI
jgi:hypothetical protein